MMFESRSFRRRHLLLALLLLSVLVAACGGGEDEVTGGVASIDDLDDVDAVAAADELQAGSDDVDSLTTEEAGLALSACMRDAGYTDFPDASVNSDGRLDLRDALVTSGTDLGDQDVRTQLDTCRDEVGAENFGVGGGGVDRGGIEEALLGYTECLRDEGVDVGDISFDQAGNGGAAPDASDGTAGAGQPRGQGGAGGNRGDRIAGQLGLDTDDPHTSAALDSCQGALDEAFAGIGVPGAGTPPATDG